MSPQPAAQPIAVIGVGNEFRGDDGVGWSVVTCLCDRLRRDPPPGVALHTCDGEPARLLSLWQGAEISIVIDAARTGATERVGRVQRFVLDGTLPQPEPGATSSHGLGLAAAVELARVLGRLPRILIVYAVEGGEFGLGRGLSPAVSAAVGPTTRRVEREVRSFALAAGRAARRRRSTSRDQSP